MATADASSRAGHQHDPIVEAQFAHDVAYWKGGPTRLRLDADIELMRGVALKGHPYWAIIMFLGVRIGGPWWLPFPSIRQRRGKWRFSFNEVRWGYGYRYPRYKE